jgi:phosphoadenosine phosphosulfate reductase
VTDDELDEAARRFEHAPPGQLLSWAGATFGDDLVVAAAMTLDVVLVDLAARAIPGVEVVFLDTYEHFPETLETAAEVERRYPIRLRRETPEAALVVEGQHRTDPNACCHARKVLPLERALAGRRAWVTGMRRVDAATRTEIPVVQRDKRGLVKINPIASWTDDDVAHYAAEHGVPLNPLLQRGYPSIGCAPCTRPVAPGESGRAGRWAGMDKTECGLHV